MQPRHRMRHPMHPMPRVRHLRSRRSGSARCGDHRASASTRATASAIWGRIRAGQRQVMVRSIYAPETRALFDQIASRIRTHGELSIYSSVICRTSSASSRMRNLRDPSGRTAQGHLISDTGRVYLFLSTRRDAFANLAPRLATPEKASGSSPFSAASIEWIDPQCLLSSTFAARSGRSKNTPTFRVARKLPLKSSSSHWVMASIADAAKRSPTVCYGETVEGVISDISQRC